MNSQKFEHWLVINLPRFKEMGQGRDVVLIMDNAPYHTRGENKVPTKNSSKKQDMIESLEYYGISIPSCSNKHELDALIRGTT